MKNKEFSTFYVVWTKPTAEKSSQRPVRRSFSHLHSARNACYDMAERFPEKKFFVLQALECHTLTVEEICLRRLSRLASHIKTNADAQILPQLAELVMRRENLIGCYVNPADNEYGLACAVSDEELAQSKRDIDTDSLISADDWIKNKLQEFGIR